MKYLYRFTQLVVLTALTASCVVSAKAEGIEDIYDYEISQAVISGTGTNEDPYILDPELAPLFTVYLQDAGYEALEESSIIGNPPDLNQYLPNSSVEDFLIGTAHTDQTNGGYWYYISGGMSPANNGAVCMKKVMYQSYNEAVNLKGLTQTKINTLLGNIYDIASMNRTNAISYVQALVSCTYGQAVAFVNFVGIGYILINAACIAAEGSQYTIYSSAVSNHNGLVHAEFNTAYNGYWYATSLTSRWTSYNTITGVYTAREPATIYGYGSYYSKSS